MFENITIAVDDLLAAAESDKDLKANLEMRCEGVPEDAHRAATEMVCEML